MFIDPWDLLPLSLTFLHLFNDFQLNKNNGVGSATMNVKVSRQPLRSFSA